MKDATTSAPGPADRHGRNEARAELLRFALSALAYGAPVIALRAGEKKPVAMKWQEGPGLDERAIRSIVQSGANLAIRGGLLRDGEALAIIDVDHADPVAVLRAVEMLLEDGRHATLTVRTGREGGDGTHIYVRVPTSVRTLAALEVAPGVFVEVRAAKASAVAAGSVHPSGRAYTVHPNSVAAGSDDPFAHVAAATPALLRMLEEKNRPPRRTGPPPVPSSTGDARLDAALCHALAKIAGAPDGQRNSTVRDAAFFVGSVAAHATAPKQAEAKAAVVAAAADRCPDEEEKSMETAGRAFDRGLENPAADRPRPDNVAPAAPAPEVSPEPRPSIVLVSGQLPRIVAEAGRLLPALGVYQRGGGLVRIVHDAAPGRLKWLDRPVGAPIIIPVEPDWLRVELGRVARFERFDEKQETLVQKDCPNDLPRALMAQRGAWSVPALVGVAETPPLRPDGSLRLIPGFDEQTGLLFDPGSSDFSKLPSEPARTDAQRAYKKLRKLVWNFPFITEEDFAAWLAILLSVVARHLFNFCPPFILGASRRGSGKSLLARLAAIIVTGRQPAFYLPCENDDEDRKRLATIALEGDSLVVFDNMTNFGGGPLDMAVTTGSFTDRLLGLNKNARPEFRAVVVVTGNNIVYRGDMIRRVILSTIQSDDERPAEIDPTTFDQPEIIEHVLANRAEYVGAVLTIAAAYLRGGRPPQVVRPHGGFEQWRKLVPAAIVYAGGSDAVAARDEIPEEADAGESDSRVLVAAIVAAMGEASFSVAELVAAANSGGPLFDTLRGAAPSKNGTSIDAKALGKRLQRVNRAVYDGYRVVPAKLDGKRETRDRKSLWRVLSVPKRSEQTADPSTESDASGNARMSPSAPWSPVNDGKMGEGQEQKPGGGQDGKAPKDTLAPEDEPPFLGLDGGAK